MLLALEKGTSRASHPGRLIPGGDPVDLDLRGRVRRLPDRRLPGDEMNTSETTEQAIRRISTAPWVKVQRGDQTGEHMATEHALRRPGAPSTRCSISLVHLKSSQADGTRPPCRSCLRSIEADAAMQIPIPGPDGALAQAVARAAEFRDAARTLAGMLADAKVHPATIGAVLVSVVSQDTTEEVMAPWR